jgi:hypothetical protein
MGAGRFPLEATPEPFRRGSLRGVAELAELGRNLLKYRLVAVKNRFRMFLVIVLVFMLRWKIAPDPVASRLRVISSAPLYRLARALL